MFWGLLKRKKIAPTSLLVAKSKAAEAEVASALNVCTYSRVASFARLSSAKTPTVSQQLAQLATSAHAAGWGGNGSPIPPPPLLMLPPRPAPPAMPTVPPVGNEPPLFEPPPPPVPPPLPPDA